MTEIIRPTNLDYGSYYGDRNARLDPQYKDDRNVDEIERLTDGSFVFEKELCQLVADKNPKSLTVIETGCGRGNTLGDIKKIAAKLGINTRTTGITLNDDHIDPLIQNCVDEIAIFSASQFIAQRENIGRFDLDIDFYGALSQDDKMIRLHPKLLAPGGLMFAALPESPNFISWSHAYLEEIGMQRLRKDIPSRFAVYKKP